MFRAFVHRAALTRNRSVALGIVVAFAAVFAVTNPAAAVEPPCDVTVVDRSELKAAMLSGDEVVCLGASIGLSGDHVTVGSSPKTLDLNGFDLDIVADKGHSSIDVPPAMSLTLQATGGGSFIGRGSGEAAGIGGAGIVGTGSYGHSGAITITSGRWTASGGMSGAGIGGGWGGTAGAVTITGGIVTATGGLYSAGIGGGDGGAGGRVTITGGIVSADAGEFGAGIGGGVSGSGGDVTVSGGRVTANGGCRAPAVGSGAAGLRGGTLTVVGLGTAMPSGAGAEVVCSEASVGINAATVRLEGEPGISFDMAVSDETSSADAQTVIGYSYEVATSVGGVITVAEQSPVAYGELLTELPPPTPPVGRAFDSWRLTAPTGPLVDFAVPVTSPVTVFASWVAAPVLAETGADTHAGAALAAAGFLTLMLGLALLVAPRARRR